MWNGYTVIVRTGAFRNLPGQEGIVDKSLSVGRGAVIGAPHLFFLLPCKNICASEAAILRDLEFTLKMVMPLV